MKKNRNNARTSYHNTRISYLYRDACNNKLVETEIVEGRITPEQIDRIENSLIDGEYFDPAQVGLRVLRFSDHGYAGDPQIDGPLHEWGTETEEYTSASPTVKMTAEDLVRKFERAHASAWNGLCDELSGPTQPVVTVTKKVSTDSSWAEIARKIRNGESDLRVGDEITFKDADGDPVTVQVAHLNPYAENEVAFVLRDCWKLEHRMNEENTNDGGWKESEMRKWLNSEVLNSLPEDLRSVIKTREVRQDLGGNELSVSYDNLWLLSFKEVTDYDIGLDADDIWFEIFGEEDADDIWFEILGAEKSMAKSRGDQATGWWLRTPRSGYTTGFQNVSSYGNTNGDSASFSYGVVFGFLI